MGVSIYELSFLYFKYFNRLGVASLEEKQAVTKHFQYLLNEGWTTEELIAVMKRAYVGKTSYDPLTSYANLKPEQKNLLKQSEMFYHTELRLTSPQPTVSLDYNTGEVVRHAAPYHLELRGSYSLNDLMAYYKSKPHLYVAESLNDKRLIGALNWLLNQYDVELILFMIDAAELKEAEKRRSDFMNPSNLHEFYGIAKNNRDRKMSNCKQLGGAHVVPKARNR